MQTPAGALVDRLRSKRALIAAGIVALAVGALLIAFVPRFWSVMSAQILIGGTSSIFGPAICAVSLPLLGEMLAKGKGRSSMLFMSACVVTTQLVITLLASWSGRKAGAWGRKPLLLIAFAVLPVRAVLYTLTHHTIALVAIQILDGVGAGIFGVVSVLVIADLTQGSGRFNLTLGAISTAVGIGASLSQVIAGSIVHRFGYNAGFLFLAAVAAVALGILYFFMPETRDKQFPTPTQGAATA
jgi:MFS family permease